MGKSRSKRGRVLSTNANRRLPLSLSPTRSSLIPPHSFLRDLEDRRTWNPEGFKAPARSLTSSRHRLKLVDKNVNVQNQKNRDRFANLRKFPSQTKAIVAFEAPRSLAVCVRRSMRREVLHALKKAGKTGQKRPKRNWMSAISCRRKK